MALTIQYLVTGTAQIFGTANRRTSNSKSRKQKNENCFEIFYKFKIRFEFSYIVTHPAPIYEASVGGLQLKVLKNLFY